VEPFLRGDLSVAASALEREGLKGRADLLLARFPQKHGSADSAADRFEAAGSWHQAAEQRAQAGEYLRAAELFEKVGDLARAAEMYNADGDLLRAGGAYEEAGDFETAIICYREAGDDARLLDALEKQGESFAAAELALEHEDVSRAIRNFQQVGPRDDHYFVACRTLASLFSEQGKLELAVQKADEAITSSRPEDTSADTFVWYGNLLARAGRPERALQIFCDLADRTPDHPGVETRIEALKKEVSQREKESSATQALPAPFGETSRYQILEEIGSGGMGIVFRARDSRLGREVALKRLPDNLKNHPRAVELFLREARAAAALNHANIVTIHDVDQEDGLFFITMELMVGRPLSEVLRKRGRLAARDAARIGLQVAAGLGYAHGQRIVHRDIKTANLFFNEDRVLKIMDFGLAKMLEEVRRCSTVVGGTPYYMAPEQSAGESVDGRADLYAFGVTLFELLTGRRPFEEGDVAYQHRHSEPPDPRGFVPDIPDAFAELILQLLAKDPGERPATAEQVAAVLRPIAGQG
jgi:tetratricopeptide (TPR) repeat protein